MKYLFNKLSAFTVMLMCMSAIAQAEIVYHEECAPTFSSRGFNVECWEDTENHRFYSNPLCTNELTRQNLAQAVVYAKLPSIPITGTSEFDVMEFDDTETWGVKMNWAAETTFSNAYTGWSSKPRYAEFTVEGNSVADARLVWMKNQGNTINGIYIIKIYVNSTVVYSFAQTDSFEGVNIQYLQGLKKGDVVKFEVTQINAATSYEASPTFKACLEYTFTDELVLNANEDPDNVGVYYTTFYDSSTAYKIDDSGATAYTATISADNLLLTPENGICKGEAVILRSNSDKITLLPVESSSEPNPENVLRGVDEDTTQEEYGDYQYYMLSYGQNKLGFYKMEHEIPLSAHKAFLPMPMGAPGKAMHMVFVDDDMTGINRIENGELKIENSVIYNLKGMRMNKLQKGINIVNGKKIFVE